ncbi:MAG: LacI family DNA-binding transcriptional regulator [Oscillospiraceae bacterium]|nr:LacI family DNA-binding transcriptional regulator [Oscillospiraceae bacterium]
MDSKKNVAPATLKDISARLNISATSVHRALTGKDGISDSLRQRILETAREMGYEKNYVASSIKRKTMRIAAVLPQDQGLYFQHIWRGLRSCANDVRALNVEVEEYVCADEQHQAELIKKIADAGPGQYSGVITFSYTNTPPVLFQLLRLLSMNICTILIDDEYNEIDGIYSIPANAAAIGELAAEFGALIVPETGTVLVSQGRTDSHILANKIKAFRAYLEKHKPGLRVVEVPGYSKKPEMDALVYQSILGTLRDNPDTVLYYALTSADNRYVVRAVEELNLQHQVSVIATDLNSESAKFLREGRVKAVIDQGAYAKGFASMNLMVDCVVKRQDAPQRFDCPIDVVLRSNLSFFERVNR